jgi:hypothetical protein
MRLLTCLLPQKKQSEIAGIPEGWPHSELASIEKAAAKSHRKNENPAAHVRPRAPGASRQAPCGLVVAILLYPLLPRAALPSRPGDPIGLVSEAVKIWVLPRKPLI